MIKQEHIDSFNKALTSILEFELRKGNSIEETSFGWPDDNTIIIFLKKPFFGSYDMDFIEYRELNDPHWCKAEYFSHKDKHVLACKF